MAYVPVPKDLTQVKTKLVFNLTKRQLIFSVWRRQWEFHYIFCSEKE